MHKDQRRLKFAFLRRGSINEQIINPLFHGAFIGCTRDAKNKALLALLPEGLFFRQLEQLPYRLR